MAGFGVSTDRLGKSSGNAEDLATAFEGVYNALQNRVSAVGNCWGDDETGKAFEQNYAKNSKDVLEALREMGDVVRSIRDGVETMAKGFKRTEQRAAEAAAATTPKVH